MVDTVSGGPAAGASRLGVAVAGRDGDAEGDPGRDAEAEADGEDVEALALGEPEPVAVPVTDAEVCATAPAGPCLPSSSCPTRGWRRAPLRR
ncbi:hypothetical protein SVIOM342S_04366 [Streptomyces violaceorubidus]